MKCWRWAIIVFQVKCFDKILQFKQAGKTLLFVSHGGEVVQQLCEGAPFGWTMARCCWKGLRPKCSRLMPGRQVKRLRRVCPRGGYGFSAREFGRQGVIRGGGETPYLSVVATARNDDHSGNLSGRTQVFVDAWIDQGKRHNLSSELILSEWNAPAGRQRLAKALHWPSDTGPCEVRIIEVPPEVPARYRQAAATPWCETIARNVGIRRARGEFILATNIDTVFSDELVRFLASRRAGKRPHVQDRPARCDERCAGGWHARRTACVLSQPFDPGMPRARASTP